MNYTGTIIEESLKDKGLLQDVKILKTRIEPVTPKDQTPWLKQWTLHKVEIPEDQVSKISERISKGLDYDNGTSWYADYKNNQYHYIIFQDKIFQVDLENPGLYKEAREYGIALGIPEYQVDFKVTI